MYFKDDGVDETLQRISDLSINEGCFVFNQLIYKQKKRVAMRLHFQSS